MSHKNFEQIDNVENIEQVKKADKLESKETIMDKVKDFFESFGKNKEGEEKQETDSQTDKIKREMEDERKEFLERLRHDGNGNLSKVDGENKKSDIQSEGEDESTHGENGERTRFSDLRDSMKYREEELER